MTAHTPGPWKATKLDSSRYGIDTHDMTEVGDVRGASDANAALIAAAPDLLEALKAMMGLSAVQMMQSRHEQGIKDAALSAIAKAEGR